jgi:putative heme iron utilization protein
MSKNNQEHIENFLGIFKGFLGKNTRKLLILTKNGKKMLKILLSIFSTIKGHKHVERSVKNT